MTYTTDGVEVGEERFELLMRDLLVVEAGHLPLTFSDELAELGGRVWVVCECRSISALAARMAAVTGARVDLGAELDVARSDRALIALRRGRLSASIGAAAPDCDKGEEH